VEANSFQLPLLGQDAVNFSPRGINFQDWYENIHVFLLDLFLKLGACPHTATPNRRGRRGGNLGATMGAFKKKNGKLNLSVCEARQTS
jgi:hypothetical protein